jgi:hypothetical protein
MSGKGKSKLLEWCLYQDIAAGSGCGLIDPHSLLADDLLRLLVTREVLADPDIRHRLIYVDPARTDYIIPFNVLATQAAHPYDVAAAVLEAFRRTWPECLREAPHFSNIVMAALIVLIENGLTLMHMPRLLTNTDFREQCLERVTDGSIVEFFHDRYDRWGRDAPVLRESTLNKIGAFSLNPCCSRWNKLQVVGALIQRHAVDATAVGGVTRDDAAPQLVPGGDLNVCYRPSCLASDGSRDSEGGTWSSNL